MALSLVSSFGGGGTNVYLDLTGCDSVITTESLNYAAWTAASTTNRQIAILRATRVIDSVPWWGEKYYEDDYEQGLEFPRTTPALPRDLWALDEAEMLTSEQTTLERACAFQALYTLANSGTTLHRDNIRDGVMAYNYTMGGAASEGWSYGKSTGRQVGAWNSLCEETQQQLAGYQHGRRLVRA